MFGNSEEIENWEEALNNFININKLLDSRNDFKQSTMSKIRKLTNLSGYKIRKGNLPKNIFLSNKNVKTIVQYSAEYYSDVLMYYIEDQVSKAFNAAQEVKLCKEGKKAICDRIEKKLEVEPKMAYPSWYLEQAYEEYLEGEFDPRKYTLLYHNIADFNDEMDDVLNKLEDRKEELGLKRSSSGSKKSKSSSSSTNWREEIKRRM